MLHLLHFQKFSYTSYCQKCGYVQYFLFYSFLTGAKQLRCLAVFISQISLSRTPLPLCARHSLEKLESYFCRQIYKIIRIFAPNFSLYYGRR